MDNITGYDATHAVVLNAPKPIRKLKFDLGFINNKLASKNLQEAYDQYLRYNKYLNVVVDQEEEPKISASLGTKTPYWDMLCVSFASMANDSRIMIDGESFKQSIYITSNMRNVNRLIKQIWHKIFTPKQEKVTL